MKSVRVFMVLRALEPLGSVLVADPNEDELEEEHFDFFFQLIFATAKSAGEVEQALATISEIESATVAPWADAASAVRSVSEPATETKVSAAVSARPAPETTAASEVAVSSAQAATPAAHNTTIRVDISRLDNLLNLIGELVIDRTQIARLGNELRARYAQDELVGGLQEATHRVARITAELQDEIMKTRMLPIDGVFQRMPRMVRDLAQKTAKEVEFEMSGGETELDRSVLESLGDPLIHLLRNSVDHGVEEPEKRIAAGKPRRGKVLLAARHEENHIVIEIRDDGNGIDPAVIKAAAVGKGVITQSAADQMTDRDALNLIFASGLSTAKVVSDISGRGVGMDIVKSNLEKLCGRIYVESKIGKGSRFTIHLPLTLAIVRALLVTAGGGTYVLPIGSVVEMLRLGDTEGDVVRRTVGGQAVMILRGHTVPLANLSAVLSGHPHATASRCIPEDAYVGVVGFGESQVGLCVDGLVGEQDVVIKSLGKMLGDISGLSGATILGDGRVALIVDIAKAVETIRETAAAPELVAA